MDPERLDEIVAAIPSGRWMSYGDVARAAGGSDRHARALNQRFIRARRPARTACSRATAASAAPRWATRRRSAAASRARAWSSRAGAPTRPRGCGRRRVRGAGRLRGGRGRVIAAGEAA